MYSAPGRTRPTNVLIACALIVGLTHGALRHHHLTEDDAEIAVTAAGSVEPEAFPARENVRESAVASAAAVQITSTATPLQSALPAARELRTERLDELPFPKNRAFTVRHGMFLAEPRDPVWSPNTEGALFDRIAQSSPATGLTSIEVECRTTICRVQLSLVGGQQADFLGDFSLTATMHGYSLRERIKADLGLDVILFDSGIVYGTPMSLLYLRRNGGSRIEDNF